MDADGERTIGYNNGFKIILPRDRVEGFYRKYNGWSIDEQTIVRNPDLQIFIIKTTDKDDNPIQYMATRDDIIDHGIPIEHHQHGSQYCLPWKYWTPFR
jgi:hypothetical protein